MNNTNLFRRAVPVLLAGLLCGCGNPFSLVSGRLTSIKATADAPYRDAIAAGVTTTRDKKDSKIHFTDLHIKLKRAPPLIFVFPDGFQVNSRDITPDILKAHFGEPRECQVLTSRTMPVYQTAACYGARRAKSFSMAEPFAQTRPVSYDISFYDPAGGEDFWLEIHTCNYNLPNMLGTSDGSRFYDMPIDQDGLNKLFNIQTQVEFKDVILDRFYICDPEQQNQRGQNQRIKGARLELI